LKRLFFVVLFIISFTICASQMKREAYIDIPTANFTQGLYINVNSSYPVRNVDDVKFDPNIGIDLSYRRFGAALKWYDGADFALDLSYQILKEGISDPGLVIGVSELSNNKYVSSAGSDDVFNDEDYPDRPPEVASVYLVGTKRLNRNFEMTAGIGRGKFVGYGPVSKYLNIDALLDVHHGDWMIGLFGGVKVIFSNSLAFIAEIDGRDANIGLEYQNKSLKGSFAVDKFEHIGDRLELSPRVNLEFSYRIMNLQKEIQEEKKIIIAIKLIDKESREPVTGHTTITNPEGDIVGFSEFKSTHPFALEPGVYTTTISAIGYRDRKFAVTVKGTANGNNSSKLYPIELSKTEKTEEPVEKVDHEIATGNFREIKEEVEEISIKYPFQRAYLNLAARTMLKRVVKVMVENEDFHLLIIGHSCYEGSYGYSQRLSERRAENLKEFLVERGVPYGKISTEGRGERDPIADGSTEKGRTKNRRTNFVLYRVKR
jgi:outer membrane protein OmpA-like peptidoglycan-associated protein